MDRPDGYSSCGGSLIRDTSDGVCATFAGADLHGVLNRLDEDLAVAGFARLGGLRMSADKSEYVGRMSADKSSIVSCIGWSLSFRTCCMTGEPSRGVF